MSCTGVAVLYTSMTSDATIRANQDTLDQFFFVKKIQPVMIDGADPANKELRSRLFDISARRVVYPQVFLKFGDNDYKFIGDFDTFHGMIESDDVDGELSNLLCQVPGYVRKTNTLSEAMANVNLSVNNPPPPVNIGAWAPVPPSAPVSAPAPQPTPPAPSPPNSTPSPWTQQTSKRGETYWWNASTGESSWVNPSLADDPNAVWVPQMDHRGRKYYYNRKTGESKWNY